MHLIYIFFWHRTEQDVHNLLDQNAWDGCSMESNKRHNYINSRYKPTKIESFLKYSFLIDQACFCSFVLT